MSRHAKKSPSKHWRALRPSESWVSTFETLWTRDFRKHRDSQNFPHRKRAHLLMFCILKFPLMEMKRVWESDLIHFGSTPESLELHVRDFVDMVFSCRTLFLEILLWERAHLHSLRVGINSFWVDTGKFKTSRLRLCEFFQSYWPDGKFWSKRP